MGVWGRGSYPLLENRCVVWSLVCGVSVCVCVCVCVKSVIYNKENDMTTASETVRKQIE